MNQKPINQNTGLPAALTRRWGRSEVFPSNTVVKTTMASLALLFTALVPAHATLLAYEGFNYSAGSNLSGQSGGFGWGNIWQQQVNGDSSVSSSGRLFGGTAPSRYHSLS